ncbi:MAG: ABC transporter substrate-binding protein [Chloroflexia bacterium]
MFKRTTRFSALSLLAVGALLLSACGAEPTATPVAPTATTAAAVQETKTPLLTIQATNTALLSIRATATAPVMTESPTPMTGGGGGGEAKIGFAFATSGGAAVYGASQRAAAEMAIAEINAMGDGPKLVGIFEDTAGTPDQAFTVFQKFINADKVHAIIGPTLSNEALTSDPEAQKNGVPVLAVSNTASGITDIGDYIFRDSLSEGQVIPETIMQATSKLGITKVSLMYANDDAFSKSGADVFRAYLQRMGTEILSEQTFSTNDVDFKAQLNAVKAENPDAIVVSALINPAKLITQQARNDVGIGPEVHIIGGNGFNSPALIADTGGAAEGVVVGAAWNSGSTDELSVKFIENFNKANGKNPDQFAAQSYAGVYILYDAIKRADVEDKPLAEARTAIRDALKSTRDFPTVLGSFSFTGRDADHPPVVQIVRNGKFEILK